jgi:sugar lactone lactonase YvrE
VHLFATTFGVTTRQATEAVDRLASGLSLSTRHISFQQTADNTRVVRRLGCLVAAIVLIIVLGAVVVPLMLGGTAAWTFFGQEAVGTEIAVVLGEELPGTPALAADKPADYAQLVDSVGGEGIALGQFVDPRAIAVARDGMIYVADYDVGRVQRFDAQGSALGMWQWDADRVIQALAVGTEDDLYAVQAGDLVRFDRQSGESLGELTYESPLHIVSFSDVDIAPNGDVVALNHFGEYVRFDARGGLLQIVDVEETASAEQVDELAVDGLGNVYLLASYEDALGERHHGVFMFDKEGNYLSRFGSDGDEEGQFTSPSTIAVDGQGRIYVSDFPGILTFSNSGAYLGTTDPDGFVLGIAFNNEGEMLAVGNANMMFRYAVPEAGQ